MNIVGVKWVFKIKKNEDGDITRYKARMVAKGYTQEYGIDYHDTFAPVLKYKTLRIIMALSVGEDIVIEQMDVKTAFLNADVSEDIYIQVPDGMRLHVSGDKVLKLRKALYGIKQAPHEWNKNINTFLLSIGFRRCVKDTCLYIKITRTGRRIIIGLFVDDMTISYSKKDIEEWMKMKQGVQQELLTSSADIQAIQPELTLKPQSVMVRNTSGGLEQAAIFEASGNGEAFIGTCPDCGSQLEFAEGCAKCHVCGFSECG